jgi:1,4-dihydroxy-6-naphthoate synthase
MKIHIAHSPDSDDAFMFWALSQGVLDTHGLEIEHVLADIETLNRAAFAGRYEVTALSVHAYAYLHDRYQLMPSGASFGDGYGPVVVAKQPMEQRDLAGVEVAIPGELTSAALTLRLWQPAVTTRVVPFDTILDVVAGGEAVAGVVIHEGQLTYGDQGLHAVADLGKWWHVQTGGPLPLGANGIRRDLPEEVKSLLCRLLRESIDRGLAEREQALDYALRFARGIETDRDRADRFVGMYVNEWTRDYGDAGRRAVQGFLDRAHEAGLIPQRVEAEFIAL